jgi:hypothetical protein
MPRQRLELTVEPAVERLALTVEPAVERPTVERLIVGRPLRRWPC